MVRRFVLVFLCSCTMLSGLIGAQEAPKQELVTVNGQVIDSATKQPIAGAKVVMMRVQRMNHWGGDGFWDVDSSPQPPDGIRFTATTDASGRFSFTVGAPGAFYFHAKSDGYLDYPSLVGPRARGGETSRLNPAILRSLLRSRSTPNAPSVAWSWIARTTSRSQG